MLRVLIDDDEPSARLQHTAHLLNSAIDFDRVFKRFRGVYAVERRVDKRQFRHGSRHNINAGGYTREHCLRNVEPINGAARILIPQHPREPALAAPDVQHLFIGQVAEILYDHADMLYARIDGRREVLFIPGSLIETLANLAPKLRAESRRSGLKQPMPQRRLHAFVRKIGRPVLPE